MDPKNVEIILKNDHKWSFFNIIYTFLFGYYMVVYDDEFRFNDTSTPEGHLRQNG